MCMNENGLPKWSRWTPGAGLVLLMAGCSNDLVSPLRQQEQRAAARPVNTLNAWPTSAHTIQVEWTDNVRNEDGWEMHRSTTGATGPFSLLVALAANSQYHIDAGLTAATQYCYQVRSFRTKGVTRTVSDFTVVACAITKSGPPAPSGLSAVPFGSTVRVTWVDNATGELNFTVQRAPASTGPWTTAATLPANTTSFNDYARPVEQAACYRAGAGNDDGYAFSSPDCTVPPARPENLAASTTGTTSIDVTWSDMSAFEDGYELERATDGYSFSLLASLPPGAVSYSDAAINPDQAYQYRVRAVKDGGFSSYSELATGFVVNGPPGTPAIMAIPSGSTAAWVNWGVSPTTASIRVERSPDGTSGWEQIAVLTYTDQPGILDPDRAPEVQMCYRVFASNGFGESAASNVDCTIPLAQPTNLATTQNEDLTLTTTWTDNSSHEEFYFVSVYFCYPGYYCEWYYDAWLDANATGIGTWEYEYPLEIRACGDGGCSDYAISGSSAGMAAMKAPAQLRNTPTRPLRERMREARRITSSKSR